jgi:folate-dependent phosphoribosylglycinamide formyltransferase PurN
VASRFELAGVVLVDFEPPHRSWTRFLRYLNPLALARHLFARRRLRRWAEEAEPLVRRLSETGGHHPELPPGVPTIRVTNVNDTEAVAFVRERAPDIVCVNGTNLLRSPMLGLIPEIPLGVLNLHTGLSPYSRGGNCNLFMILEGRPELVGVTIHHIDPGIDSGDIVRTARPELAPDDTVETIDARSWRLGIDLMLESIADLAAGRARRVPQWTEGTLFLRRTGYVYSPWQRVRANRRLARGLVRDYRAEREERDRAVRLVGPPGGSAPS